MRIAILDDDLVFAEDLKDRILSFEFSEIYCPEILVFTNSEDFFCVKKDFDIVFVDYKLEDETGMEVAKRIRSADKHVHIVFVTAFPEYVFESFKVDAFRYLVKPLKDEALKEVFDSYTSQDIRYKIIKIPEKGKAKYFKANDIIFLETEGRYTIIYTNDEKYMSKRSISEIEGYIDSYNFFRISRFFVINFDHVKQVVKSTVEMENGRVLTISRGMKERFNKQYIKYLQMKI